MYVMLDMAVEQGIHENASIPYQVYCAPDKVDMYLYSLRNSARRWDVVPPVERNNILATKEVGGRGSKQPAGPA
jgi:hypothetical protein